MAKHETLAAALAAFQAEVPKMSKDERAKVKGETNDGRSYDRSYDYAGLDQFVETVEPVLGSHGLSVSSAPTWMDGGRFVLVVSLLHEGGEIRTGYWPLPDPSARGVGPQDIGSAMTYGRRYVGWGLTGTFPGGIDDDGKQAQQVARERWEDARPAPVRNAPAAEPTTPAEPPKPPKTTWTDDDVAQQHGKLGTLPVIQAVMLYDWMAKKGLHERAVSGATATKVLASRIGDDALKVATPEEVAALKDTADALGLLKVQVSETETLDQVFYEARELAVHAAVAQAKADTPDSQAE